MARIRIPAWALLVIGTLLAALAVMGITNSVHVMAKVVYGILIAVGLGIDVLGLRKRRAAS